MDGWMEARINPSILKERFDGWMDGNSIFSPCKNIIFKKASKKKPKSFKILL